MGLGHWLRRRLGGTDAPPAAPKLRISQEGRLRLAEVPGKHLGDANGRRDIARELMSAVAESADPLVLDFRSARVIPHTMREPLLDLSERARRRKVVLAFVVSGPDQREFFTILQLDRHHRVVFDPKELAGI